MPPSLFMLVKSPVLKLIIKNYRIQDTTYSEVDSKCEIDSFSKDYETSILTLVLIIVGKCGSPHSLTRNSFNR